MFEVQYLNDIPFPENVDVIDWILQEEDNKTVSYSKNELWSQVSKKTFSPQVACGMLTNNLKHVWVYLFKI
jgi:hypothetical protein